MSSLYRLTISTEGNTLNQFQIQCDSINNDSQVVQSKPIFYFALAVDALLSLREEEGGLSSYFKKKAGILSLPDKPSTLVMQYIQETEAWKNKGYSPPIVDSFETFDEATILVETVLIEEWKNRDNCACGKLLVTFRDENLCKAMRSVTVAEVVFDQEYF